MGAEQKRLVILSAPFLTPHSPPPPPHPPTFSSLPPPSLTSNQSPSRRRRPKMALAEAVRLTSCSGKSCCVVTHADSHLPWCSWPAVHLAAAFSSFCVSEAANLFWIMDESQIKHIRKRTHAPHHIPKHTHTRVRARMHKCARAKMHSHK